MDASNFTACHDDFFGPIVGSDSCRGGFDFTLNFEDSLLSLAPSAAFVLGAGPRVFYLLKQKDVAHKRAIYTPKIAASCVLFALQLSLVAITASAKRFNTSTSLPSAVLNLLAATCIVLISHLEHVKSVRPSVLLTGYLFLTILFDVVRIRTEWLLSVNTAYAAVLSTSLAAKLVVLTLENTEKRSILIDEKELSTESTSGPLNRGLFVWLDPLFMAGWKGTLSMDDLPTINEKLQSDCLADKFGAKWDHAVRKGKPSMFRVTVSAVKWDLLNIVVPRLAMIGLKISQPFLISQVLRYLNSSDDDINKNVGYGLIGAYVFVFIGSALLQAFYEHLTYRVGAIIRGGIITLIYRKLVKLPITKLGESSAVALMGNDVESLVMKLNMLLVESWANALTVAVALYMLAEQLGPVCVAPIIMALISLTLNSLIGKGMITRLKSYQQATQERLNFTTQVIESIKGVKMLGYVEKFTTMLQQKRKNDLDAGRHFRWLTVAVNAVTNINSSQTETVTFGAFAIVAMLSGKANFTAAQATIVISILSVLMNPLSELLGHIPSSLSAFASFVRIEAFLLLPERTDDRNVASSRFVAEEKKSSASEKLAVSDADFSWGENKVLSGINTSLPDHERGSLIAVIGPVGSGKSSLLKSLLGETTLSSGTIFMSQADVSFCDQTPWIMNASIRDNIVAESGGYDQAWFGTVIEACDLKTDLDLLEQGDETVVGDKGLKLSGGQKQRIALARAVYSRKKLAIFDDIFSGLDRITEQTIFTSLFSQTGLLRQLGTTVIMATHAVNRLPDTDFVIALDASGSIIQQGKYSELLLSPGYVQDIQVAASESQSDTPDDSQSISTDAEQEVRKVKKQAKAAEEAMTAPSDRSVFKYYFSAVRGRNLFILAFSAVCYEMMIIIRYVWLTWWGDAKGHESDDLGYWLGLYAAFGILRDLMLTVEIIMFLVVIGPVSGYRLHDRVLQSVMNASMSFLSGTESGNLINRFSQDMRLVDFELPIALGVFILELAGALGATSLAIAAVSYFAIALPFVIITLAMVQRFYIRTSKQIRLLEIEHKAPLYAHFLETISGLATVRAYAWVGQYEKKNLRLLDDAQKPSYLMSCIQRWLNLVLDLVVALLTIVLVSLAIFLRGRFPPALLGMALVNMMSLGMKLKNIITHWSMLETSLGAVARIKHFSETTPCELLEGEDKRPDDAWPTRGLLELRDLVVTYDGSDEPTLRNLNLIVQPGEKIGICGRSGSGKSSTIQALLRMVNIESGTILIDGEDISEIPRNEIRKRMSCLTQDPFMFTDSVRFNMDPLGEHHDDDITAALQTVGLWDVIAAKTKDEKILDEKIDESFLSHGQRQMFCLGRALLKKSQFLILDEPTSNVDSQTDAKMQEIIRSEFEGRTIIMIAHRLHTLMDFDRIAVLDQGRLVEVGKPADLLADGGVFAKLYYADIRKKSI